MTDPIIIEKAELAAFGRNLVHQTLIELGIKVNDVSPWISQNRASQLIGRSRLESAMSRGQVEFYKRDQDKKTGRVFMAWKDVQKMLNNPIL
jgi:hypothetical protein